MINTLQHSCLDCVNRSSRNQKLSALFFKILKCLSNLFLLDFCF